MRAQSAAAVARAWAACPAPTITLRFPAEASAGSGRGASQTLAANAQLDSTAQLVSLFEAISHADGNVARTPSVERGHDAARSGRVAALISQFEAARKPSDWCRPDRGADLHLTDEEQCLANTTPADGVLLAGIWAVEQAISKGDLALHAEGQNGVPRCTVPGVDNAPNQRLGALSMAVIARSGCAVIEGVDTQRVQQLTPDTGWATVFRWALPPTGGGVPWPIPWRHRTWCHKPGHNARSCRQRRRQLERR
jgi:hypothetical protein